MKIRALAAMAAVAMTLGACADGGPPKVVKSPDSVLLTENDITDRPYEIVKDLDVWVHKANLLADDPTREQVATELKKQAAELNADAVILVRYGTVGMGLFNWGEIEGRGRAVVFKK